MCVRTEMPEAIQRLEFSGIFKYGPGQGSETVLPLSFQELEPQEAVGVSREDKEMGRGRQGEWARPRESSPSAHPRRRGSDMKH